MTSRPDNRPNDRPSPGRDSRPAWQRPTLRRLTAGAAENGLTPSVPDGGFSTS